MRSRPIANCHIEEPWGIDVSPDLVSAVADAVREEIAEWRDRPLDACYPQVFLDAIRVKIRNEGFVRNKAVHVALGIQPDGTRKVLGLWTLQTEGAKFRLRAMNEPKARGVENILMAVTDGLKGFPEAIEALDGQTIPRIVRWSSSLPDAVVQTCIVHLVRHSLDFISWKHRKAVVPALRAIHRAQDAEAGLAAPFAGWSFHWKAHRSGSPFEQGPWGQKYPAVAPAWRRSRERVVPFLAFPEAVRRIVHATNAIEALNAKLRRAVRARGHFPNDEAATKLLHLVPNEAAADWKRPPREWGEARTQFAITFGDRFRVT